jgi:hypothetical protein
MSEFVSYDRRPEDLPKEIADTLSAIAEICGKSTRTMLRTISLLKLPDEVQAAIRAGNLSVSQGYLFAANLDCPDRDKIFEAVMKAPVTYLALEKSLTAWKKPQPDPGDPKPIPMTKQVAYLRTTRSYMEMGTWRYTKPDLEIFIDELRTLLALAEQKVQTAPEPAPEKPVKKKPPQV